MIEIIIEILFNISFISNKKQVSNESKSPNEYIEISEENLKEKIINFCLNSLKSFINIFKTLINKKNIPENNRSNIVKSSNSNDNLSQFLQSKSDLSQNYNIKTIISYIKKFLSLLSVYFISIPAGTEKDKEKIKKYSDFAIIIIDMIYDMKTILKLKPSLITSVLYFIIKTKTAFMTFGNETSIKVIFLCLSIGWPNYENDLYKYFCENFNVKLKKFNETVTNSQVEFKKGGNNDASSNYTSNVNKTEKINEHKKEYINFLADVACWYYFEHFYATKVVLKILGNVFKSKNGREKIFIDLIKWNMFSKSNRDNLKSDYRAKILKHSQTYLGKKYLNY